MPRPFSPAIRTTGLGLLATLLSTAAMADVPAVATDIAPVHSLVAMVMGDLGTPALIVQPGASPHGYSMRPSEAQALDSADLVVWMGEALTPWLEGPIDTLASGAHEIELMSVEGTVLHGYREGATFAAHDHDHDAHDDHDNHDDHDDHAEDAEGHDHDHDHDHDHAEKADGHDHDHDHDHAEEAGGHDDHDHDHTGADAHAWLDPVNARLWLGVIAEELSELDPDNASTYAANASAAQADLESLENALRDTLSGLGEGRFVVFHDAYQYFERRFDLAATGAISIGDASAPSAGRIAELQAAVAEMDAVCVFAEPQFNRGVIDSVFADTAKVGVLDPLGLQSEPGAALYPQVLRDMAAEFVACLRG